MGTVDGTNQILKFNRSGVLLDAYTVPVGARGAGWIDLAVDQTTMFYTSEDGSIRVFRTDRQPLAAALWQAGVQPLPDATLDPDNLGLFGRIVVKNHVGSPLVTPLYRVRVLPPGDGSGGLLVVYGTYVKRTNFTGDHVHAYGHVSRLFAFDLTPDGKSVWMMTQPTGDWATPTRLSKSHLPTGTTEVEPMTGPGWTALAGLCVNGAYTAAVSQPDCVADPTDTLCQPLPFCPSGGPSPDCTPPAAPRLEQPADRTNAEGETIAPLQVVASDPNGRPLTIAVAWLPLGLTFDPVTRVISGTIDWRASETLGLLSTSVRVTVTNDRAFMTRKTFTWTVHNTNAPPRTTVSPSFLTHASGAYLVSTPRGVPIPPILFEGTDLDPCEGVGFHLYSGETLPPGLTLTAQPVFNPNCAWNVVYPATMAGTPTTQGTTTFTLKSGSTNPLATFIWTVTNTAPAIAAVADRVDVVGTTVSLSVSASDQNGDPVTFSATGLPQGLSIQSTSGVISGTLTSASLGESLVTVTAADASSSSSDSFAWIVVSDGDLPEPTITAHAFPNPNAAGWHNANVTVGFRCTGVWSCPLPVVVSHEAGGQLVTGTAPALQGSQVSTSMVINLDKTAPNILGMSPINGVQIDNASSIAVTATVEDHGSGVVRAVCDNQEVSVTDGHVSCTMPLRFGGNSAVVQAVDLAGNAASAGRRVRRVGGVTTLLITPSTRTVLIGETLSVHAIDQSGRAVPDVVWSSSDPAVLTVDSDGTLRSVASGQVEISAARQMLSATAMVTVLAGASLPAGTTRWTAAPSSGGTSSLPLVRPDSVDASIPDLAIIEHDVLTGQVSARGFSGEGRLTALEAVSLGPDEGVNEVIAGPSGSLLLLTTTGLARIGGKPDTTPWKYSSDALEGLAVGADGSLYGRESDGIDVSIVHLDGETGTVLKRIPIPRSTYESTSSCIEVDSYREDLRSSVGDLAVGDDGVMRVPVIVTHSSSVSPPCGTGFGSTTTSSAIQVLEVQPDGSSFRTLATAADPSVALRHHSVIPDIEGGHLISWYEGDSVKGAYLTEHGASTLLVYPGDPVGAGDLGIVVGNVSGGGTVAWEAGSGAVKWTKTAESGYPVAALSGGGMVFSNESESGTSLNVVDAAGLSEGPIAMPPTGFWGYSYWTNGLWAALNSSGALSLVAGPNVSSSTNFFIASQGSPVTGGNQREKPTIKTFVPLDTGIIVDDGADSVPTAFYRDEFAPLSTRGSIQTLIDPVATLGDFLVAANTPLGALGFVGHSVGAPSDSPHFPQAVGLRFSGRDLMSETVPQHTPFQGATADDYLIINKVFTQVKIVFVASCWIGPILRDTFDIISATEGRTMIVIERVGAQPPGWHPGDPDIPLYRAASAWRRVVKFLLEDRRRNVGDALAFVNSELASENVPPTQWKFKLVAMGGANGFQVRLDR